MGSSRHNTFSIKICLIYNVNSYLSNIDVNMGVCVCVEKERT